MFGREELKFMRHLVIRDNVSYENRHAGDKNPSIREVIDNRRQIVTKLDIALEEGYQMNREKLISWLEGEKYIMDDDICKNDSEIERTYKESRNRMIDKTIKMIKEEL